MALKTIKPEYLPDSEARDRFLREGTIWMSLGKHPHIVCAYGVERLEISRDRKLLRSGGGLPKYGIDVRETGRTKPRAPVG